jgi:hypothetical protein
MRSGDFRPCLTYCVLLEFADPIAMPKTFYCWKCKCDVPMLSAAEWQIIEPLVKSDIEIIKEYRTETNCTLAEALDRLPFDSSEQVFKWSGYRERSPSNFYHHRLSKWGHECGRCSYLLRTPEASFCANCGEVAEPNCRSKRIAEQAVRGNRR